MHRLLVVLTAACACSSVLSGCGGQSDPEQFASDLELLDIPGQPAASDDGGTAGSNAAATGLAPTQAADHASNLTAPQQPPVQLDLNVGTRLSLLKTVTQSLVQQGAEPASSGSRLQLLLTLAVEDVQPSQILFSVRYHQVRYEQALSGRQLVWDSTQSPGTAAPAEVSPYAGMIDNGFSFWIGRNNRIRELVGFETFLQRCTQNVPPMTRGPLLAQLASTLGDDGVANFVDDSIGLLPYSPAEQPQMRVGDQWTRERQLIQPTPVRLQSTCKLTRLDPQTAVIDLLGTITATSNWNPQAGTDGITVTVHGGQSQGQCTIDRRTGLPLSSRIDRRLNMTVTLADGNTIEQQKQVVTTIQSMPQTSGAPQSRASAPSRPVAPGANAPSSQPSTMTGQGANDVVPAGFENAARAVYPDGQ